MVMRPDAFDITTPRGDQSPRSGDDEIRRIKEYTQNAWNDIHQSEGVGVQRRAGFFTDLTATGAVNGNLVGDVTGNVTGNASSATALETPREIGGVSFDGSANIDLPGVNMIGNQSTTGNAATATAWATPITFNLTGPVTGTAMIDGSGPVSIATTLTSTVTTGQTFTGQQTFSGGVSMASALTFTEAGSIALPDDSVDSQHIVDGAVDNVHISGMAASKLTGNFPAINAGTNNITTTGTITGNSVVIGGITFTVASGFTTISNGATVLARMSNSSGDVEFRGNVTANSDFS